MAGQDLAVTQDGSSPLGRRAGWLVWGLLVVGLWPHALAPIVKGLDPSWIWGINHASDAGARPGQDVVFPYGPLGSLLWPVVGGPHLRSIAVARLVLHFLF